MSHYTDEYYDVYSETVRRAHKNHVCDACKREIKIGHFYCSIHTVFDDSAETIKRCGACQLTHKHLRELGAKSGMWPDERLNCGLDYEEEWGEPPPEEIAALPLLDDESTGQLLGASEKQHRSNT